jgi:hypothetical protein
VFAVLAQTPPALQVSSVQGLLSSQLLPPVGTQVPVTQWSPVVHPSLSLQGLALLFVALHPVAGTHVSSVHAFPSLQTSGGPPAHALAAHVSLVVHLLPSSQGAALAVWTQTPTPHESSVHGFPSSQFVVPVQVPAAHLSPVVQELPSLQTGPVSGVPLQVSATSSHEAVLH